MAVIGIAGLPGSGKSRLIAELQQHGYSAYDDIRIDWIGNLPNARSEARSGKNVAVSDIMFCSASWRGRLEQELCVPVQWIFFENSPWQCAKNCLYRFLFENPNRSIGKEIRMILVMSQVYRPFGEIRPVW